jgi:hypothetical protein
MKAEFLFLIAIALSAYGTGAFEFNCPVVAGPGNVTNARQMHPADVDVIFAMGEYVYPHYILLFF